MADGFQSGSGSKARIKSVAVLHRAYDVKAESVDFGTRVPMFKSLLLCSSYKIWGKLLYLAVSQILICKIEMIASTPTLL